VIEVWMHKETGIIALATTLYRKVRPDDCNSWEIAKLGVYCEQAVGVGLENMHGVIIVYPFEERQEFEVIGEL
jgi:hypothetical protein